MTGLRVHVKSGLEKHVLAIAECCDHIRPRGSCGAGVVGGEFHVFVWCLIAVMTDLKIGGPVLVWEIEVVPVAGVPLNTLLGRAEELLVGFVKHQVSLVRYVVWKQEHK